MKRFDFLIGPYSKAPSGAKVGEQSPEAAKPAAIEESRTDEEDDSHL